MNVGNTYELAGAEGTIAHVDKHHNKDVGYTAWSQKLWEIQLLTIFRAHNELGAGRIVSMSNVSRSRRIEKIVEII